MQTITALRKPKEGRYPITRPMKGQWEALRSLHRLPMGTADTFRRSLKVSQTANHDEKRSLALNVELIKSPKDGKQIPPTIMQWKGRRRSTHVEDARNDSPRGMRGGGGGAITLLTTIGRVFGFKGILAAVVVGVVLWKLGIVDPSMLMGGGPVSSQQVEVSPLEQERFNFVEVVLADTEDVFTAELARHGVKYEFPKLKIYRASVPTACGTGSAAMGPFYCPADRKIYIDLSFYDELAQTFQAPGDFAQAYVVAHEVGHHVQNLLGASGKVAAMRGRPDYNQQSVRLELQADFYAGVWAHHTREHHERGDIEEAMRAANAIGDDAIQKKAQGRVVPHSFTHGTSEQRMRWFMKGFDSGKIEDGDTFSMRYEDL